MVSIQKMYGSASDLPAWLPHNSYWHVKLKTWNQIDVWSKISERQRQSQTGKETHVQRETKRHREAKAQKQTGAERQVEVQHMHPLRGSFAAFFSRVFLDSIVKQEPIRHLTGKFQVVWFFYHLWQVRILSWIWVACPSPKLVIEHNCDL